MNRFLKLGLALCAMGLASAANAQEWKPSGNVELVAGAAAGGGSDLNARFLQRVLGEQVAPDASITVVNRPGAGQSAAIAYVSQHSEDPNYLVLLSASVVNSALSEGKPRPYTVLTPIAKTVDSVIVFYVKADSPIKTVDDLMARLKQDVASTSFAFSTSAGNTIHIGLAELAMAAGQDPKNLKIVVNDSGSVTATQVAGGHVDVGMSSPNSARSLLESGAIRMLAVAGPKRLASFPDVPTFKELGVDLEIASWYAVFGPQGLKPEQVEAWRAAITTAMQSEEATKTAASMDLTLNLVGPDELTAELDAEWDSQRSALISLGLLKE